MSYTYKMYIANGREYFIYGEDTQETKTDFPLGESLMRVLDLDYSALYEICRQMDRALMNLYSERTLWYAQEVRSGLNQLADMHIFFEFLRLDWRDRLRKAEETNFETASDLMPHKKISHIPSNLCEEQRQITAILQQTLDLELVKADPRSPAERLQSFYQNERKDFHFRELDLLQFEPLSIDFMPTEQGIFCEVLQPKTIYDLIEFTLRENIKREQKWRVCKNCKRYFPLTGRASAEYCDRPAAASGSTCKEVGSTKTWEAKKSGEECFKIYRREYKRRFAWIRLGKCTQEQFSAWSVRAQKLKAECESGELSLEQFTYWLKNS